KCRSLSALPEQLLCPICLDVFRLPVSTPCGHNFCSDCIRTYWQSPHLAQCPVCKHRFYKTPDLKVNTFISEVASHFRENKCEIVVVDQMISCRRQTIFEINQAVDLSKRNTEREVEESLQIFEKLIQILLKSQAEVVEAMKTKQGQVLIGAAKTTTELQQEVERLKTRKDELELLSCTEDNLYLLQKFPDFSTMPAVRALRRAASELEEAVKAELKRLCATEFKRARRFAVDLTLDPKTAHPKLMLSESKREVYHSNVAVRLPADPQRFYPCTSVLGTEGFSSGRFYFEVQVKGKTEWDVGVALESVQRKGGNWLNPERGYWTLGMRKEGKYWALCSPPVCVPLLDEPQRVGVYVDVGWGQVSFYNPDSHSHIYTFTGCSFSERLFPHLNPRRNHGGVNSAPLVVLPVNM
uniref:G protein-coupled receptor 156 n=1 Tax=Oryzias latipes TaxID=8090 RepID=A0A3P9MDM4_ORYLA